jgi:hypothetical protein
MADEDEPRDEPPAEGPNDLAAKLKDARYALLRDLAKKYDQAFFLDLAAKGKDAWNAWWRESNRGGIHVTFAGIDFSEAPRDRIDFSGFDFGDEADFSRCKWRPGIRWPGYPALGFASFKGAAFGNKANFTGAAFDILANFTGAAFGDWARFDGAAFGSDASFVGATFGTGARLKGAAFGVRATFFGAAFGGLAKFHGAAFGNFAQFTGATFGFEASFDGAAFGTGASFKGAAFGRQTSFAGTIFKGGVEFNGKSEKLSSRDLEARVREVGEAAKKRHEDSWTDSGSGPDRFLTISFTNARFDNEAVFSGRTFEGNADFTNARFYSPPSFDNVTNASRVDFTGAYIGFARPGKPLHWTNDSRIPVRLRAFRKFAEETKNHDLERDLYIEERKAERGVFLVRRFLDWVKDPKRKWALIAHILWIAVMAVYWALADYGRSFMRPAAWLIVSGFFFYWGYLAVLTSKASPPDVDKYKHAVRMLALGNAVPFVGPLTIDSDVKKFLFCPRPDCPSPVIPPECYQLLVVGQNLFSITCVFFIGLALRNYFKIK